VVTGGKLGYVIAVDPNTGAQVWKTAVGGTTDTTTTAANSWTAR
jgi:outer membrane protein assembly factor BamB